MSNPSTVWKAATTGFSDGAAYDAHRPSYPPQAVSNLLGHLGVAEKPGARIVDLAAGTGKFTELLARRPEGFDVVAVEPLGSMRAELERKGLDRVDVREGMADGMDVEDGWADAVIVAQAFHWFAKQESLEEIHRVLKPGAQLAMIWNIEDYNKPKAWKAQNPTGQALNELIWSIAKNDAHPRFKDNAWQEIFQTQAQTSSPLFSTPIREETVPFTVWLTFDALMDRVKTLSQVANLVGEDAAAFRARVEDIVSGEDVERNEMGEIAVHGVTYYAWTGRL